MGGLLAAAALWMSTAVDVQGATTCPAPQEVAAWLDELGHGGPPRGPRAHLAQGGGEVAVALAGADGEIVARRTFPASLGCGELAQAIAVSVATWLVAGPASGGDTAAWSRAHPQPAPPSAPRRAAHPAGLGVQIGARGALPAADPRSGARVGGVLAVALPRASGWIPTLGLAVEVPRSPALVPDVATGTSALVLGLGRELRAPGARIALAAHAGFGAAVTVARGDGYDHRWGRSPLSPLVEAGLKARWTAAPLGPWVALGATYRTSKQAIVTSRSPDAAALPRAALTLSAGVHLCACR
jgi:hypothetical protein